MKTLERVLDIDSRQAAQLHQVGIRTLRDLVKFTDLQELSARSGVPLELIQQWRLLAKQKLRSRYSRRVAIGVLLFALGALLLARLRSSGGDSYSQAHRLFGNGDYTGAAQVLDKALAREESAPLHNLRGLVYLDSPQPNYDSAVHEFRRALSLDSNYKFAYLNEGIVLRQLRRYDDALVALDEAIRLDPKYGSAYFERGAIYHDNLFKYGESYEDSKQAHLLEPDRTADTADLAEAALTAGRFEEAQNLASKLLAAEQDAKTLDTSENLAMRFVVISALLLQGKPGQAKPQLEEFVSYYKRIGADFKNDWNYSGTRNFITHSVIEKSSKNVMLQLADLLEQRPQANISQIEKSIFVLR